MEETTRENSAFYAKNEFSKAKVKENARKFDEIIAKQRAEMMEKMYPSPKFIRKNIYEDS